MRGFISSTITGANKEILRLTSPVAGLRQEKQQQEQKDQSIEYAGNNERNTKNAEASKINGSMGSAACSRKNTVVSEEGNNVTPDVIRFHSNDSNKNTHAEMASTESLNTSIFERIGYSTKSLFQQSLSGVQSQIQNENSAVRKVGQGAQNLMHKTVSGVQSQIEDENSTIRKIGSGTGAVVSGVQSGLSAQLENDNSTLRVIGKNTGSVLRKGVEGVQSGVVVVSTGIQSQLNDENSALTKTGKHGETLMVELRSQIENENSVTRKIGSSAGAFVNKSVTGVSARVQSQLEEDSTIRNVGSSSYEWASQWIEPLSSHSRSLLKQDSLEAAIAASTTPLHDSSFVHGKYGGYSIAEDEHEGNIGVLSTLKTRAKNLMEHVNENESSAAPLKKVLSVIPALSRCDEEDINDGYCSLELFLSEPIDDVSCKVNHQYKTTPMLLEDVEHAEDVTNFSNTTYPDISCYIGYVAYNSIYPNIISFLGFVSMSSVSSNIFMFSSGNDDSIIEFPRKARTQSTVKNEALIFESSSNKDINFNSLYSNLIPFLGFVSSMASYHDIFSFLGYNIVRLKFPNESITCSNIKDPPRISSFQQQKELISNDDKSEIESIADNTIDCTLMYSNLILNLGFVDNNSLYPDVILFLGFLVNTVDLENFKRTRSPFRSGEESKIPIWKKRATGWIQNVSENERTNHLRRRALSVLTNLPEKVIGVVDAVTTRNSKDQTVVDDTCGIYPNLKPYLGFYIELPESTNPAIESSIGPFVSNGTDLTFNHNDSEMSETVGGAFLFKWKRRATDAIQHVNESKITNQWRKRVISALQHSKDIKESHEEIAVSVDIPQDLHSSHSFLNSSSPVKEVSCIIYHDNEKYTANLSDNLSMHQSTIHDPNIIDDFRVDSVYLEVLVFAGCDILPLCASEGEMGIKDYLQVDQNHNLQLLGAIEEDLQTTSKSIVIIEKNTNSIYPDLFLFLEISDCHSLYPDLIPHMRYEFSESTFRSMAASDCDDGYSTSICSSSSVPINLFLSEDKLSLWRTRANDLILQMRENNKTALKPDVSIGQEYDEDTIPSLVDGEQTINVVDFSTNSRGPNAICNTDDNLTISSSSTFSSAPASLTSSSKLLNLTNNIYSRFQSVQVEARKLQPTENNGDKIILQRSNSFPDFSEEASVLRAEGLDRDIEAEDIVSDPEGKVDNVSLIQSPGSQEWAPCGYEGVSKSRRHSRLRHSVESSQSSSILRTQSITPGRIAVRGSTTTPSFKRKRRRPKMSLDSSLNSLDPQRRTLESIMNENRQKLSMHKSFDSQFHAKKSLGRVTEQNNFQELNSLHQSNNHDIIESPLVGTDAKRYPKQIFPPSSNKKSKQQQMEENQKLLTATTNIIILHLLSLSSTHSSLQSITATKQLIPEQKKFAPGSLISSSATCHSQSSNPLPPSVNSSATTIVMQNIRGITRPALSRDSSLFLTSTIKDLNFSSDEDEDEKKSQDGNSINTAATTNATFYSSPLKIPNIEDDSTVITGIKYDHISNPIQFVSTTKWSQMVSMWKHSQMMDAMTSLRPISHHYMQDTPRNTFGANSIASTSSSSGNPSITLSRRKKTKSKKSLTNRMKHLINFSDTSLQLSFSNTFDNLNGFSLKDAIHHEDLPLLSLYFVKLGTVPYYYRNPKCSNCSCCQNGIYRWGKNIIKQYIPKPNPSIQDYLFQAEAHLSLFSQIIKRVILFTTQNSSSSTCRFFPSENQPSHSISIKAQQSIRRKAQRKYNGDISQVKDMVRAQVVLPDEGSIVCALLALKKEKDVKIVRIKNLFYCVDVTSNRYVESNLPSGYRHVLVNMRFSDGFICEFQLQLAPMYDLLGEEGYSLHSDLNKVELWKEDESSEYRNVLSYEELGICDECRNSSFSSDGVEKLKKKDSTAKATEFNSYLQSLVHYYYPSCQAMRSSYNNMYTSFINLSTSCHRMIDSLVTIARHDIQSHPHDIARYICLAEIHKAKYMLHNRKSDSDHVIDILKQSLLIADQATASGMTGWLEYGESQPLDRMMERPLYILANLASFYARANNWSSAASTFWTLLLRCEQHIPLYHPLTITCMLDLAACLYANGDVRCATQIVQRANTRLALYLVEQEKHIEQFNNIMLVQRSLEAGNDVGDVDGVRTGGSLLYQSHRRNPFLDQLQIYVARLKHYINRPMMVLLGNSHHITLLFHCYVADVLSVLANCRDAISVSKDQRMNEIPNAKDSQQETNSYSIWNEAGIHYSYALQRWLHVHNGIYHSNVIATCSALARTLREINSPNSAVDLMSIIVSVREITPGHKSKNDMIVQRPLCRRIHLQRIVDVSVEKNLVICLWWLSVYFVESNPDKKGRTRALSLLNAISDTLQQSQEFALPSSTCLAMLHIVEKEAKDLSALALTHNPMAKYGSG